MSARGKAEFIRVAYLVNEYDLWCTVVTLDEHNGVYVSDGDLFIGTAEATLSSRDGSIAYWRYLHQTDCEWLGVTEDGVYEREGLFAYSPMSSALWANAHWHMAQESDSARITSDTFLLSQRAMRELARVNQLNEAITTHISEAPVWLVTGDHEQGAVLEVLPIYRLDDLVSSVPQLASWSDEQRLENHLYAELGCNPSEDRCLIRENRGTDMEPNEVGVYASSDPLGRLAVVSRDDQGRHHALGLVANEQQARALANQWLANEVTFELDDELGDVTGEEFDLDMDDDFGEMESPSDSAASPGSS